MRDEKKSRGTKGKNQKAERERVKSRGKRELLKEGFFLLLICFELINFLVSFSPSYPHLFHPLSHRLLMRIKRERDSRCERN